MDGLAWLLDTRHFMPHGYCYTWQPSVLYLHVGANALIAGSYFAIPAVLYGFVRKRRAELPFPGIALLFAAFILLCGLTHAFGIWTIWNPAYRLEGLVMLATGLVSAATAVALLRVMPAAMALRGPATLAREVAARTAELAEANAQLQREAAAREAATAALVASERRFQLATRAVRGYIYETDRASGTVSRSEGFVDLIGIPAAEAPPTAAWWLGRVHPDDLERLHAAERDLEAAADGTLVSLEYRVQHRDGRWVWIWDRAVAMGDPGRPGARVIGSVVDITERRLADEERNRLLAAERAARTAAEEASRVKDQFLATLSHELRTPLSTILMWARILATRPEDAEQVRRAAGVIDQNARAQAQLVSDLLDLARIEAGKLRLDLEPVELGDVVDAAIATLEPAAQAKRIRLQKIVEPLGQPVLGDAARLQQVLWNLLSNAVKFTPKDGRIVVTLARVHSQVELSVSDTGRGLAPEFLPHVFTRFAQADGSSAREHGGLGLGLSIVKHLVEMHGGEVRVRSAGLDQGATFTIVLPLVPVTAGQRHPAGGAPSRPADLGPVRLNGRHLLVVDDAVDGALGLARLLEEAGARVSVAHSAAEGLARLAARDVDLLISDIGMPGTDGYQFIAAVRAAGHELPAVALTAYARAEDRARAQLAGFDAHLGKPVEPIELLATLAALARAADGRRDR